MLSFYFYLIVGILLVALEIVTTTFYLLVIGIASIVASLTALILHDWTIPTVSAGVLAVGGCLLLNRYKNKKDPNGNMLVNHIGQEVEVVEVNTNSLLVLYSGTYWTAKTASLDQIKVGDQLYITKFSNYELEVERKLK